MLDRSQLPATYKIAVSPLMVRVYAARGGPPRPKSFDTNELRQFFRANPMPKVFYLFPEKSPQIPEYVRGTAKKCSYIYRGQIQFSKGKK